MSGALPVWGERGLELVKELERAGEAGVPAYNGEAVRGAGAEMGALAAANQRDVAGIVAGEVDGPSTALKVKLRHAAVARNRRCLAAYHHGRLVRLKGFRWSHGAVLPAHVRPNVSEAERTFFRDYSANLAAYASTFGRRGLDLTSFWAPPKSLLYEVRVLLHYGPYETEEGHVLQLTKHSIHTLPRQDCEALLRQGVLQHIGYA